MRLLVVSPGSGWILDRIADSIASAGGWSWMQAPGDGSTNALLNVGSKWPPKSSPRDAEAILYWDVQNCWGEQWRDFAPSAVHVGAFTHLHEDLDSSFRPWWGKLDGIVHMCRRYHDRFLKAGWYHKERMTVLPPGQPCSSFRLRPLRLGACQRGGFLGKGDPFLFEALAGLPMEIRCHVELRIKGSGWEASFNVHHEALQPLSVIFTADESPSSYPGFYDGLDYLLIPSLWEGGPMALQEALACGVPVIAADVGFVSDFLREWDSGAAIVAPGCTIFPAGNHAALAAAIESLVRDRMDLRSRVQHLSWASYAQKLEAFVETLRGL